MSAAGETPDLNLPAFEFSLTNAAHPLIIERSPSPESISRAQDRKSIVEFYIGGHSARSTLRVESKQTIGTRDD
jgi:hypothetical protein